jgi:hypothetical protein
MPENTDKKQDRDRKGKWKPGQSGNPNGRPQGARNRATLAAEELLDGEAENLTRKAIDLAMKGDIQALRLCLDKILPSRRDRPIRFTLHDDFTKTFDALLQTVARGEVTPDEAEAVSKMLEARIKAKETIEFDHRLSAIEDAIQEESKHR